MNDLQLTNQNGQIVVSSRQVAASFDKDHKHVLEAIEKIKAENSAVTSMFYETSYQAGTGKNYKEYLMNRDGFTLLAMGFTGAEAMQWKIKYIQAFNEMEKQLKALPQMTQTQIIAAIAQAAAEQEQAIKQISATQTQQAEELTVIKHRIDNLDLTNIEGTPRQRLAKMVSRYAHDKGITHQAAWGDFIQNYNTAYNTNLILRRNNYRGRVGRNVSTPEYLEANDQIEDAIRVADKMLNKGGI